MKAATYHLDYVHRYIQNGMEQEWKLSMATKQQFYSDANNL